jgi:hypothetical protein
LRPPPVAQPDLVIDPQYLDFGEVWEGKDQVIHLPVRNTTSGTVHVSEFQTSCNCEPIEPKSLTVPAGETREIRVTLGGRNNPSQAGQPRRVEIEIRPVVNGRAAPMWWAVRGTIRPLIQTDLSGVLFGDSNRVGQSPVSRTLKVRFHVPGTPRVTLVPEVAAVEVRPGADATEWKVVVSPLTDRTPGPYRGTLTIANVPPGGNAPVASLDLPVDGVLLEADQ